MGNGNNKEVVERVCSYLEDTTCNAASEAAGRPITTTPEICKACAACSPPQNLNEVTLALAGLEESDEGPGTTLHNWITWFIPQPINCSCPNRVKLMNAWGKQRCRQEIPTILNWLRESALDNNIKYSEFAIAAAVRTLLYLPGK